MKVIVCYSFKGGVGKILIVINMVWFVVDFGQCILFIDFDF